MRKGRQGRHGLGGEEAVALEGGQSREGGQGGACDQPQSADIEGFFASVYDGLGIRLSREHVRLLRGGEEREVDNGSVDDAG